MRLPGAIAWKLYRKAAGTRVRTACNIMLILVTVLVCGADSIRAEDSTPAVKRFALLRPVGEVSQDGLKRERCLSPDGTRIHLDYWTKQDRTHYLEKTRVQVNDRLYSGFNEISGPGYSDDGSVEYLWYREPAFELPGVGCVKNQLGCCVGLFRIMIGTDSIIGGSQPRVRRTYQHVVVNGKHYGPYDNLFICDDGGPAGAGVPVRARDGGRFAFAYVKDGRAWVHINGTEHGPFEGTEGGRVSFSGDMKKFGYSYQKDGKNYVLVNGRILGPFDPLNSPLQFNHDGSLWGFSSGPFAIINGARVPIATYGTAEPLRIGPDGRNAVYGYIAGGATSVRIGGKDVVLPGKVNLLWFNREATKFAYQSTENRRRYVFFENEKYGPVDNDGVLFGEDGGSFAVVYEDALREGRGRTWIGIGGVKYGPYDSVENIRPWREIHLHDARRFAFVAKKGGKYYTCIDGKTGGPWDHVECLLWRGPKTAGASSSYLLAACKGGECYALLNNRTYGPMKHVTDAVMSGDGSRFAFTFGRGSMQYAMLDGKEYPAKGLVHFTRDNRAFVGYVSGGHACIEELK